MTGCDYGGDTCLKVIFSCYMKLSALTCCTNLTEVYDTVESNFITALVVYQLIICHTVCMHCVLKWSVYGGRIPVLTSKR